MGLRSWDVGELAPVRGLDRESSEIRLRLPERAHESRPTLPTLATAARVRARVAQLDMDWDDEPDVPTNPFGRLRVAGMTPVESQLQSQLQSRAESQVLGEYPALCAEPRMPQPESGRGALWTVIVSVCLAASFAMLFWAAPAPVATVVLRSVPQDARLLVDGVAHGQSSPFIVTQLSAGELHELRIERPGYRAWWTRIRLRDGEELHMPTVSLLPAPEAAALASAR